MNAELSSSHPPNTTSCFRQSEQVVSLKTLNSSILSAHCKGLQDTYLASCPGFGYNRVNFPLIRKIVYLLWCCILDLG